jgi:hypothetical protein
MKPLKVVYCYARKDKKLQERLESHLEVLKRSGQITSWHDGKILPGADWEQEIFRNLNTADIILLLISDHFINSGYCYNKEMQKALERRKAGSTRVIPVIIRPVEWKETPIGTIQALPDEGKPITLWRNKDKAFQSVVQGVKRVIDVIRKEIDVFCPTCWDDSNLMVSIEENKRFIWCLYCGNDVLVEEI